MQQPDRPLDRYLDPHQARERAPTAYESLLGDAIERAFGAGIHDLPGLIGCLNRTGPNAPDGRPWTEDSFAALMAKLGH